MSKSETKTKSTRGAKKVAGRRDAPGPQKRDAAGAQGFYVYCVGGRDALAPLFDEELPGAIEGESALELVGGGLAAVVSRVPLEDYGEGALASRLDDATWTATRALRHERVVEHFARRAAVAPPRFGAVPLRRQAGQRG